ncbi:MAG: ribosome biogenesis GTPase Der [Myxococcaceae bacterium]|nr:ribosome biogenesis GTPase Der [Myxococcaceae bacterium]
MAGERRALVALVGRPNVGKSTLFNRLIGRRQAIVEDSPGVTRDRHYADAELVGRPVTLIDTGGFVSDDQKETSIEKLTRQQAQAAVEECAVVVLVTDGRAGRNPADEAVATFLRKSGRPLVLVVNKADDLRLGPSLTGDFHRLGLGEPLAISAEHGHGIETLREAIVARLPEVEAAPEDDAEDDGEAAPTRVAIVGRPNVGKSTLVNALLGQERMIANELAGTTRDAIDSPLERNGQRYVLTDTAGIRRKAVISQRVEQFSVIQALRVIEESDVAAVVIDGTEPAVDQDARIAGVADEKCRPLFFVVNKWDLVHARQKEENVREELKRALRWVAYAPVLFISAKEGRKVDRVLEIARELQAQTNFKAPTSQLNKLLENVIQEHPLPFHNGKALRIYYIAQVGTNPPTFQFVCNRPGDIPDRYKRYLTNQLRETFGLRVPIRLRFLERPGKAKRAATVARYRGIKKAQARR